MTLRSFYPVVMALDLPAMQAFYTQHFLFEVTFESDWYVSLKGKGEAAELALLDPSHPTVPEAVRKPLRGGLLLNVEVDDVDREYERLKRAGLPMHLELRDEAFGQRHFITSDPAGTLLDVIQVIPPSEAFAQQYAPETLRQIGETTG